MAAIEVPVTDVDYEAIDSTQVDADSALDAMLGLQMVSRLSGLFEHLTNETIGNNSSQTVDGHDHGRSPASSELMKRALPWHSGWIEQEVRSTPTTFTENFCVGAVGLMDTTDGSLFGESPCITVDGIAIPSSADIDTIEGVPVWAMGTAAGTDVDFDLLLTDSATGATLQSDTWNYTGTTPDFNIFSVTIPATPIAYSKYLVIKLETTVNTVAVGLKNSDRLINESTNDVYTSSKIYGYNS